MTYLGPATEVNPILKGNRYHPWEALQKGN